MFLEDFFGALQQVVGWILYIAAIGGIFLGGPIILSVFLSAPLFLLLWILTLPLWYATHRWMDETFDFFG